MIEPFLLYNSQKVPLEKTVVLYSDEGIIKFLLFCLAHKEHQIKHHPPAPQYPVQILAISLELVNTQTDLW